VPEIVSLCILSNDDDLTWLSKNPPEAWDKMHRIRCLAFDWDGLPFRVWEDKDGGLFACKYTHPGTVWTA